MTPASRLQAAAQTIGAVLGARQHCAMALSLDPWIGLPAGTGGGFGGGFGVGRWESLVCPAFPVLLGQGPAGR